ncbi:MAG: hypothetical protein P0116_12730 [Candidatus Nitrosocosmicus sp.]|nr:hypothetical protein [Candidatus Nitrosocosmicus sp.]
MSNITKTHKVGIFAIFIAAALIGSVVSLVITWHMQVGRRNTMIQNKKSNRHNQINKNGQCVVGHKYHC